MAIELPSHAPAQWASEVDTVRALGVQGLERRAKALRTVQKGLKRALTVAEAIDAHFIVYDGCVPNREEVSRLAKVLRREVRACALVVDELDEDLALRPGDPDFDRGPAAINTTMGSVLDGWTSGGQEWMHYAAAAPGAAIAEALTRAELVLDAWRTWARWAENRSDMRWDATTARRFIGMACRDLETARLIAGAGADLAEHVLVDHPEANA